MKLKDFSLLLFTFLLASNLHSQYVLEGTVVDELNRQPVENAEVYNTTLGKVVATDELGKFSFKDLARGEYELVVFTYEAEMTETKVAVNGNTNIELVLSPLAESLSEVVINQRKERIFALRKLKKVEGTAIYAGKKNEVVVMDKLTANLATNNARQIYSQVVGLNIYDNGDAGLQLNIGGRGLDPNRTQNFNTRQNGYDISADVLGYPESYYTPPPEALEEVQIIRGAASLQYGTQFGGLINFKLKKPNKYKKIELVSRQSLGSYNLFTSFNSVSGTLGKFSYYTYFHYKTGEGFRPNSGYDSYNAFGHINYQFSEQTSLALEYTFLDYLAQQPGGLTDSQFYKNPDYSNRSRNWFKVNWNLFALKFKHQFSKRTDFSLNLFGLDASRKALGFRENRVSLVDDPSEPRELLIDNFKNWGAEARVLTRYDLKNSEQVLLLGAKYYQTDNSQRQGPGTAASNADFSFDDTNFPNYRRQTNFDFPNKNVAFFGENIFNITNKLSVTPGFRLEYINTEANGVYKQVYVDLNDDAYASETFEESKQYERNFLLLGVGTSYQARKGLELYANFSQNYRSVTFSDIRVVNPVFQIDPNITDEEGFTADIGLRGKVKQLLNYDINVFGLRYNKRIGEVLKEETRVNEQGEKESTGRIVRFKGNIGDAFIYGVESFAELNLIEAFNAKNKNWKVSIFSNLSYTQSEYTSSQENNVEGNEVEFIPHINLKTGIGFGYKNLLGSLQYTYLSKQYTDATNSPQDKKDNQSGIRGAIPSYGILDLSLSYRYKRFTLESGINNLLDNSYFTRRATGYPGPGIIPAQPITWYTTLQVKI